ncbi:MAG: cyclic nucleotide-binding domain-containing protein [Magnetococcales bacterium]|nr:cyclic nucleotide-binding domain-containing protein [Magnetococcales bacterium]
MRKVLFIFGLLNDEDVEWMARVGSLKELGRGAVLIHQGTRLEQLFIVVSGHMQVTVKGLGSVAELGSGEMLGEMSFVDSAPTSATVTALDEVVYLQLEKKVLEARFVSDPGFAGRFFKALAVFLADRLRGTVQRMGYGKGGKLDSDEILEDELDETALDNVSIAGDRFDRMIRILAGARLEH